MADMDRAASVLCLLVALAGCAGLGVEVGPDGTGPEDPTAAPAGTIPSAIAEGGRNATVVDVVDGDTVDVRYPNGSTDTVRLLGIDTPEVRGDNDPAEFEGVPGTDAGLACLRDAGEEAGSALRERIAGERVRVVVDDAADRRDRYGRLLAYVVRDGTDLNRWLVAEGYARVYDTTFARADAYYAAESAAMDADAGAWACRSVETGQNAAGTAATDVVVAAVHADAAGNDGANLNDEYVVLENAGDETLAIGGWTVSDAAGHTYAFPDGATLGAGARLTLHTGSGEDTARHRYWGRESPVWNNDGDTITVRDGSGRLVVRRTYD